MELDMHKMCPNCSTVSETAGNFCQHCGAAFQQVAPPPPPPMAGAAQQPSGFTAPVGKASPAFTITALVAGVLGALSPYMNWLKWEGDYEYVELNGWDSMKFPKYYDLYASGAGVAMFLSVLIAAGGLGHLIRSQVSQKPYKSGDRIGVGVVMIVAGVGLLGNAIAQFGAFDEAAQLDLILVETGNGLSLSGFVGLVGLVFGILVLTVKSLIPVPEPTLR